MRYSEADLTAASKMLSYLRSMQSYAGIILFSSLLHFGFKMYTDAHGPELYLLYAFTGIIILGSLSVIIRLNGKTVNIYGLSCIIAGGLFIFSILYYRGTMPDFFTAVGSILGLIVIRQGVGAAFGRRLEEAFSIVNQKKVLFVKNLLKSLKSGVTNEKDIIQGSFTDDKGKKRTLSIKLLDGVACFLLDGEKIPIFFDRDSIYIVELQSNKNSSKVSINVDNHDWLEAEFTSDDFRKYEAWKNV